MTKKVKPVKIVGLVLTFLIALSVLVPIIWLFVSSFKTDVGVIQYPPKFFPTEWTLKQYQHVTKSIPIFKMAKNTFIFAGAVTVISVFFDSMAGYAFAKLQFRGKNILFGLILVQMSLPSQIFILPQYQMIAKLGMANTIFALVFPGIVSAFGTFFLRQTYMGIPNEIAEAACLDGCNQFETFVKVMFPLTGTSVAALTIFTAVFAYGDLMWPLVVNSDLNMMTLSSGLATLRGQFSTNFPVLMAGSLLAMLPMVILYMIFQRQFIEGIANTGGK